MKIYFLRQMIVILVKANKRGKVDNPILMLISQHKIEM